MDHRAIAAVFEEMATLLEITGANPFRVRAYANGARVLDGMGDFAQRLASGTLIDVKGIGKGLVAHVQELMSTGTIAELEELHSAVPQGVLDMTAIPGVGSKKVRVFWKELGVTTIDALVRACRAGQVAGLTGMGKKTEEKILLSIEALKKYRGQHLFPTALAIGEHLVAQLQSLPGVEEIDLAGGVRRRCEVVTDVDIVVGTKQATQIMESFSRILLETEIGANLRCVTPAEFPYALHHFTGSQAHNTAMRSRAQSMGFTLNEAGLFRLTKEGEDLVPCASEAEIYAALELAYVPPELREDIGELEAAAAGTLPELVSERDIRGAFHCHTTASDGKGTLEEMVAGAQRLGLEYIGISDHSQTASYAGGLKPGEVRAQWAAIDQLQKRVQGITILKGIESDILKDGALDYSDEMLRGFDFVIASIHTQFTIPRDEMTSRVCRALRHPAVRILAHPTGRVLLSREPFAIDMDEVLRVAGEEGVVVETNANPRRCDLDWRLGQRAHALGVRTMVNPDAHSVDGLAYVHGGVGIARKGWWQARDVVNTWPIERIRQWLSS